MSKTEKVISLLNVLILHGPNLNRLGKRQISIYGRMTLAEINQKLILFGEQSGFSITCQQHNSEGDLVDALHASEGEYEYVLFNPGAYSHYSYALRDAVAAVDVPVIEIHLTNIYSREDFRGKSVIAPVCIGQIMGFGPLSYELALMAIRSKNQEERKV